MSLDIGATDLATIVGGLFGGSYHGGETAGTQQILLDGKPSSPALPGHFSRASVGGTAQVNWGGGRTLDRSYSISVQKTGGLIELQSVSSSANGTSTFIGMSIANGANYSAGQFKTAGGSEVAFPIAVGRTFLGKECDITIRDPASGRWTASRSNAAQNAGYRRTSIIRSGARSKIYHEFNSGTIGTHSNVERSIEFGIAAAGAPTFNNVLVNGNFSSGLTGWITTHSLGSAAAVSGQLQLTRNTSGDVRINRPTPTVTGKTYLVSARLAGGTAPADSCSLVVGLLANGSTSSAPVWQSFSGQEYLAVLFNSPQDGVYVAAMLAAGTAGQTVLLEDFAVYQLD